MFIRLFVDAIDKEEAIKYSKNFECLIADSLIGLRLKKVEQYWKIPELYCIEYGFKDFISERMPDVIKQIGNNPYIFSTGEKINEYIFSKTTGEIYLDKIDWLLINVEK